MITIGLIDSQQQMLKLQSRCPQHLTCHVTHSTQGHTCHCALPCQILVRRDFATLHVCCLQPLEFPQTNTNKGCGMPSPVLQRGKALDAGMMRLLMPAAQTGHDGPRRTPHSDHQQHAAHALRYDLTELAGGVSGCFVRTPMYMHSFFFLKVHVHALYSCCSSSTRRRALYPCGCPHEPAMHTLTACTAPQHVNKCTLSRMPATPPPAVLLSCCPAAAQVWTTYPHPVESSKQHRT
jgi:hypothetical protein